MFGTSVTILGTNAVVGTWDDADVFTETAIGWKQTNSVVRRLLNRPSYSQGYTPTRCGTGDISQVVIQREQAPGTGLHCDCGPLTSRPDVYERRLGVRAADQNTVGRCGAGSRDSFSDHTLGHRDLCLCQSPPSSRPRLDERLPPSGRGPVTQVSDTRTARGTGHRLALRHAQRIRSTWRKRRNFPSRVAVGQGLKHVPIDPRTIRAEVAALPASRNAQ